MTPAAPTTGRHGTATSPLALIAVLANNLTISKDPAAGIYGTGHNSVIQVPERDKWYIVYHRFTYPQSITTSGTGFHREAVPLQAAFNVADSIRLVAPAQASSKPVLLK